MNTTAGAVFLWVIVPYVALTVFFVGHWWRYRRDQFKWTSRSTQLMERRILGWASPAFHFGVLGAAAGHVVGLLIPAPVTGAVGISEHFYHWFAVIVGGIAGVVTVAGFFGLLYRRTANDRVRTTTTRLDVLTYGLLTAMIVLGVGLTAWNGLVAEPFNYRDSMGVWYRSLFTLRPDVDAALAAPLGYQVHAINGWAFWAAFPFTRLVHVWSVPVAYLGRPYVLYRRRYNPSDSRIR